MAVGDVSRWSTIDAALWDVLQDDTTTSGLSLQNWRREQRSGGAIGRNYELKNLPAPNEMRDSDFPALAVDDGVAVQPANAGLGFEEVIYVKRILGLLRSGRDEAAIGQKIKKFAELVWEVIAANRPTVFGSFISATNPIKTINLGSLEFPRLLDEAGEPVLFFDMTLDFLMEVQQRTT